jgi:chromate reductase
MLSIISGSNRTNNQTQHFARKYEELLTTRGVEVQFLSLEELPHDFIFRNRHNDLQNPELDAIVNRSVEAADSFIFFSPEYNGGFTGVLKSFIDVVPPRLFRDKKAALVGVSSGRFGNVRGVDHLTGILNYVGVHVHPKKVNITNCEQYLEEEGAISDEQLIALMDRQLDSFLAG